jgi:hypothetical protein
MIGLRQYESGKLEMPGPEANRPLALKAASGTFAHEPQVRPHEPLVLDNLLSLRHPRLAKGFRLVLHFPLGGVAKINTP